MNIHFSKIDECIKSIDSEISDKHVSCEHANRLINQLEQLCKMHFTYEEAILEGMKYPSVDEHRLLHQSFLKAFEPFKSSSDQCHSLPFIGNFIKLRVKRQGYFPVPAPSLFASLAINGLPVSL